MVNGVKQLLFLVETIAYQCILVIGKNILFLVERPTIGLDNITVLYNQRLNLLLISLRPE